ncbi:3-oxoacyl-[acyl-carrier-protein] synthase 3 [Pullulanibacillus camelliae]|uniref:Beta-ketoacyl-[acyl-carrier-protein] synthase III n=1 Tax=Pullulanibacillus camelliae TaxID=1707096 RepID=A0A8J2VSK9_9BACL|nr:ketoacyl-ACP synthase III [Pullulanibacillus camelliae]GGE37440.1 3-oxoacyl-[acyl-carrier-protein] synthase 3 [Pullulanibacillus camelliae]
MQSKARITAIGSYIPEKRLTNHDIEKLVDTNDEWITKRTGIKERRIAADDQFSSDLGILAVEDLIKRSNKSIEDVDMVLVATTTPDFSFPSVASQIQAHFNIQHAGAMDLTATCAGFTYGLHLANSLVTSGAHKKVLLVATETLSKVTDYTDRSTCILFGDAASAILVEYDENDPSLLEFVIGSDGDTGKFVYRTGLSHTMKGQELVHTEKIVQNGREVYKWVLSNIPQAIRELLNKANKTMNAINWFVPHSANLKMIEAICERIDFPMERTLTSAAYVGNTSSASIPLALDMAFKAGKLKTGDQIVLHGFGGGLVHCGLLIQWSL